jgi:hypothetical protein
MSAQADLFEFEARSLPPGMRYWEDVLSEAQEQSLVRYIERLPLKPFEFAGGFKGNRRVISFGWRYDYSQQSLIEASPIPKELDDMRNASALLVNRRPEDLRQALVTEYAPGAGSAGTGTRRCSATSLASHCWHHASSGFDSRKAAVGTVSPFRPNGALHTFSAGHRVQPGNTAFRR